MELYSKDMKKPKRLFGNIKLFVLCHGLLQLTQLLYSSYFKSSITTIERRFGFSSTSSGTLSSLHEVGNTILIVFVSYFGSRVNRPRFIGLGGLLMAVSALMLTLPHFLYPPYEFDSVLHDRHDLCRAAANASAPAACGAGQEALRISASHRVWLLMGGAQLLFGVGSVPIQPYGLSYIDDFAGAANAPLYIAILFSVSVFGPAFGYLLGSAALRVYVDVDKTGSASHQELTPYDPRWVGAWWMGLLVSSCCLALTSIPYFFFPRSMRRQSQMNGTEATTRLEPEETKKQKSSLLDFLKMFPSLLVHLLLSPFFLMLVLSQCCFSAVIAGLATFLNKFLEHQYSASPVESSLLIGAVNLPSLAVGILVGGIIMKRAGLSLKAIPRFSVVVLSLSALLLVPVFFMGCSSQDVFGVNPPHATPSGAVCYSNCSCPEGGYNPVCGSDGVEYVSPCNAGCTNFTRHPNNTFKVQVYTSCSCVTDLQAQAVPGHCPNSCPHLLLPVMLTISFAGLIASLSHNPIYMMVLRTVPPEEKSFAIGIQFMLMRVLAWLPAPALFGMAIDSSCVWWKRKCGSKLSCGYYDNNTLRNRYLGLMLAFKSMGIVFLVMLGWKLRRTREYSLEKTEEGPL
ncbi:solute carrier organic anion transporter family member 2A1 [Gadus chalcogrammus]|uniref:solute carrier organic anion transporter family member 2A1 n=1 Tax=Gadus chalcogrammus TaxID=1042646 RepID=UPI0024C4D72D|nr:solute carrier organic anion transporter family member 2A1 [Gadus chalcogrammus]